MTGPSSASPLLRPEAAPLLRLLAHDVRNLITGTLSGLELVSRNGLEAHPKMLEMARLRLGEVDSRLHDVVRCLEGPTPEMAWVDLAEAMDRAAHAAMFSVDINRVLEVSRVWADPHMLRRLLLYVFERSQGLIGTRGRLDIEARDREGTTEVTLSAHPSVGRLPGHRPPGLGPQIAGELARAQGAHFDMDDAYTFVLRFPGPP